MRNNRMRLGFMVFLLLIVISLPAVSQTTTATIRGKVTDGSGNGVADAEINAVNSNTGFVHTIMSRRDGSFVLGGLTPGSYNIVVAAPGFDPRSQDLTVLVGQTIDMDLSLAPATVLSEEITVIGGEVAVEMEGTEVATQVTRAQIENLPQNDRNFMNFAALAPGVTLSTNPERKTFQAGAQGADQINVFIDGVSFKNDVIQGGVVGQDASRGNPFPQNAVQEFRVLTQNYSAEFQKSSSAVITAVTKSGTNALSGEVFAFFQDADLVDDNPLSGAAETLFERLQTGLSIGGPIRRDQMHYFFGYEGNDQDREAEVRLGSAGPAALRQQLAAYEGVFPATFELGLFFGKVSFQPAPAHLLDLSGFLRDEVDVRGFSGETSFERAEEIVNDVWQVGVRYQLAAASWLNEASVSYQDYRWNPRPLNEQLVGRNYFGILQVGGRSTEQDIQQQRLSLRDDLTMSAFEFQGSHVIKVGANFDLLDYLIIKDLDGNASFNFRQEDNWEFPFEAFWGLGDPEISGDNTQFGLYVQDEWTLTDHLLLNLGLRWDYESDMFPTDWVTPADIREKFASFPSVASGNYFTDGNDRQAIDDMFAPRLGFAYDLFANSRTVVFGGWGRYYDRVLFNNTLDERFRGQFATRRFDFSRNGEPRPNGQPTVAWRDEYLTEAGLAQLLGSPTGLPEAFLNENDTQPQYSDQWNLGVRHAFGDLVGSISYGSTNSYNGFSFVPGHRFPDGRCCMNINDTGYRSLLLSTDDKRTWYEAVFLTLDRPFTSTSRWGGNLAYTYALKSEEIGGELFSFDFPRIQDYPRRPQLGIQEHKLVANALVRLPFNFNIGTLISYGSGYPYDIFDFTLGRGPGLERIIRGGGTGDAYLTVDLRLEYNFPIGGTSIGLIGEAFNITNDEVFTNYNGEILTPPAVNQNFGLPREIVQGSQRRFQYGVRFRF